MRRACVFAHYDQDKIVDEYVYYYLEELLTVVQKLVFVTVSDIGSEHIERLKKLNIEVRKRQNIGYDFYSYKVGIENMKLDEYDELVLCNDSVFGPFYALTNVFDNMNQKKCDFWGITGSRRYSLHVQSYFMCFRKNIVQAEIFKKFWQNLGVIEDKKKLIKRYEVGLSQLLYEHGFESKNFIEYYPSLFEHGVHLKEYYMPKDLKTIRLFKMPFSRYYWNFVERGVNISTSWWETIVLNYQMPFMKKSLFFDKIYKKSVLQKYESIIQPVSDYPLDIIKKYIERIQEN